MDAPSGPLMVVVFTIHQKVPEAVTMAEIQHRQKKRLCTINGHLHVVKSAMWRPGSSVGWGVVLGYWRKKHRDSAELQ